MNSRGAAWRARSSSPAAGSAASPPPSPSHAAASATTVIEDSPLLSEVGAGIQVTPNAYAVLDSLGLGSVLATYATVPEAVASRRGRRTGRTLATVPLGATVREPFRLSLFRRPQGRSDLGACERRRAETKI